MTAQRDVFLSTLFDLATVDPDIMLLSADMGAPSLDRWRKELPDQFIATGIAEQNTINVAAGLSAGGKKVYVYFMASWAARCFEQVRYSCALAKNPITIIGNGVGLGYSPAGPAHEPNDDIAYMRSILGIEVISPSNNKAVKELVKLTYNIPKLRYVRLERKHSETVEAIYNDKAAAHITVNGFHNLRATQWSHPTQINDVCIVSSGYMLGRCVDVSNKLAANGYKVSVYDVQTVKPINPRLAREIGKSFNIVTVEEQTLSGGLGSAICELLADEQWRANVLRIGLPERYLLQNASRDYLLDNNGLSVDAIYDRIIARIAD